MHRNALAAVALASAGLVASTALLTVAGPLSPPAGPVASTYKTLTEVEPRTPISLATTPGDADSLFKITQPGSYYLTGNITGVAGRHGIEIAASGVTLDLNGFALRGVVGSFDAVTAGLHGLENIAVVNGTVKDWGGDGIDLASNPATICRVERVLAKDNTGTGISAGIASTVTGCTAGSNAINGIFVGAGSTLTGCTAYSNNGDGMAAGLGSTVTGCTARFNDGNGIFVFAGSTVTGCTASNNTGDGIQVSSDCRVTNNTCTNNGNGGNGAGIHATLDDNRIEGNNCTGADRGIDVDVAGNIIIKNTCSGNTFDWDIVANNVYGPIIDRRVPLSAAALGFSAVSTLGSTDPNANFSY